MGNCVICGGSTQAGYDDYCSSHKAALLKMHAAFRIWERAYGNVRLEHFLSRLSELPEAGEQVKELAGFFAKNPGRWVD